MDIQILKYKTLQGQYLQANNMVVSLKKALEAANAESQNLRELRKADLCQISDLESGLRAKDNTIREKDEVYSLYESCKMNNLNFGRYIEDILTRMKDGDKDYLSMLPCYYKAPEIKVEECA